MKSKAKAQDAAKAAIEKKAGDVLILELYKLSVIADYFVICSGKSTTQVKAIADGIRDFFDKKHLHSIGVEGIANSQWILIDYGDVIVHIFEENTREYYQLEKLWLDAPRISYES
ncbi:MAG: ribosome silencing factor [Nitrospiraceae bacterium]|nr:ribosome silencing factor [Nitrospiraceae bacterium]